MSDVAIRVDRLGKRFRLGTAAPYQRLSELPAGWLSAARRKLAGRNISTSRKNSFWAIRNVSFEVQKGEVLGIIGRNGAGKSTLLKVISRITEPTEGEAELWGRVGSLLEVGTGFHPELTGRENIYLNGAILGMNRREINKQFDEIVDFAEVEQFLDTPVKHYSSGMYTRLAFAVAAHLEPEILIIDEVLSVGDIAFQKKCVRRMGEVSQQGRTVITVSHNMELLASLCPRSIWIDQGHVVADGATFDVVAKFKKHSAGLNVQHGSRIYRERPSVMHWVDLTDDNGQPAVLLNESDYLTITAKLAGELPAASYFEWALYTPQGQIATSGGTFLSQQMFPLPTASGLLRARIGPLRIAQGNYSLSLRVGVLPGQVLDEWSDIAEMTVTSYVPEPGGLPFDLRRGVISLPTMYSDPGIAVNEREHIS